MLRKISLDKKLQRIQAKSCYFILDAGYHSLCGQDLMIVMINKSIIHYQIQNNSLGVSGSLFLRPASAQKNR